MSRVDQRHHPGRCPMTVVYLQSAPRPRPVPVPWLIPHYPRGVPQQITGELDLPQSQPEPAPAAEPELELEPDEPEQTATADLPAVLAWALAPLGAAALLLWLLWLGAPLDAAALLVVAAGALTGTAVIW